MPGGAAPWSLADADLAGVRTVVLVEGRSDAAALEVVARRRGRDLAAEGVRVVVMGGATNIGHALAAFGPAGEGLAVAGLCDAGEEPVVRRALLRAGLGGGDGLDGAARGPLARPPLEALGFHVCVRDLEDELIRAVGPTEVERVVESEGELRALRTFQRQAAQVDRPLAEQLHRFLGTRGGRKVRYGGLLAEVVDLGAVPRPLDRLLTHV